MSNNNEEEQMLPITFWKRLVKTCKDLQVVLAIAAIVVSGIALLKPYLNPKTHWGSTVSNLTPTEADPEHAAEDGLVTAWASSDDSNLQLQGVIGGVTVAISCAAPATTNVGFCSITFPVRTGERWWVETRPNTPKKGIKVRWTPLRSGLFTQ